MKGPHKTVKIRPDEVIIREDTFEKLLRDQFMLQALMEEGVENWEGYERALRYIGGI